MGCSVLVGIQLVTASSESAGINAAGGKSWQLAIQVLEALKMQFSRFQDGDQ